MNRSQISQLRRQFIEERDARLKGRLTTLEKKLFDRIFNELISELEKSDGRIVSNSKNLDVANALDKIFDSFNKSQYADVIKSFSTDLIGIQKLNKRYFEIVAEDQKKLEKVNREVERFMYKRIGLNTKGELSKDGYLDRLIKDNSLRRKVKEETYKAVTSGKKFENYVKDIKRIVVGDEKINGGLVQHFNTYALDTYNQFNRTSSKLFAQKLELRAFVYQGGLIKSSRPFCKKKDGRVYTTDEAQKWAREDFQGKPANYDPLVDCGGYNCRHSLDYISNSLAIRMRPELKEVLG